MQKSRSAQYITRIIAVGLLTGLLGLLTAP